MHVKCTVYHFSDCVNRATAVLSSAGQHGGTGPMSSLSSVGGTEAAGQKDCDWSALTDSQRLKIMT